VCVAVCVFELHPLPLPSVLDGLFSTYIRYHLKVGETQGNRDELIFSSILKRVRPLGTVAYFGLI